MEKLELMFQHQRKLQEKLGTLNKLTDPAKKQQFVNQMLLAMMEETVEIMRETAYKNPDFVPFGWKKGQQWNVNAFKDEIVDLWHFIMNLCIVVDMSPTEFYERYAEKNNINHVRKENNY